MKGRERHIFPGNNTPSGFFSYYDSILEQEEGQKIYCLKGGPGVGKSTMIRQIGAYFQDKGEDVDYFHCSADKDSLDAVLIKGRRTAVIDGTAPHVIDPKNPGAVDVIVNLGECWNEPGIRGEKKKIFLHHENSKLFFQCAYGYLGGARNLLNNLILIQTKRLKQEEYAKVTAELIGRELAHKKISDRRGKVKRYFASAITPQGFVSNLSSILTGIEKIYRIESCLGMEPEKILMAFSEYAKNRGVEQELFFAPLRPEDGPEVVLCPEMKLALVVNSPLQNLDKEVFESEREIITVNLKDRTDLVLSGAMSELERDCRERLFLMLEQAVNCLEKAKREHDLLEQCYLPHIDFQKVGEIRRSLIEEIDSFDETM